MQKDAVHYGGWEHRDIHNINGMIYVSAHIRLLQNRSSRTDNKTHPLPAKPVLPRPHRSRGPAQATVRADARLLRGISAVRRGLDR